MIFFRPDPRNLVRWSSWSKIRYLLHTNGRRSPFVRWSSRIRWSSLRWSSRQLYLDGRSSRHLSFSNYFLVNSHPCSEYFDDIHRKSPPPMLPMLLSVGETSCSYHQLQTGILNVISISNKQLSITLVCVYDGHVSKISKVFFSMLIMFFFKIWLRDYMIFCYV